MNFRLFIRVVVLTALMLINTSLFMWFMRHFELSDTSLQKVMIGVVHADAESAAAELIKHLPVKQETSHVSSKTKENMSKAERFSRAAHQNAVHAKPAVETPVQTELAIEGKNWSVLRFDEAAVNLSKTEQQRFQSLLSNLNLRQGSTVNIMTGQQPPTNKMLTVQIEKLRAQAVARLIFPYTQNVKIKLYHPSVVTGTVAVEFIPVSVQNNQNNNGERLQLSPEKKS